MAAERHDRAPETAESPSGTPSDLGRRGWLGRFPAETERGFHDWLSDQVVPLARIVCLVSIVFWVLIPVAAAVLPGVSASAELWAIACVNALILTVGLVVVVGSKPEYVVGFAAFGVLVIGADLQFLMRTYAEAAGPGAVTAGATFFSLLCPFLRLPVRITAVIVVALTGAAASFLGYDLGAGNASFESVFPYLVFLSITLVMVLGIAWATENQLRDKYVAEQVIARQHDLLVESRRLIRRYAPAAVADRIEHGEGSSVDTAQRRRVTVLFSDVVGFTDLADRLDPEALAQIVNEYLATLAEIIERHQGTVNEFAGDGVMALFGAPVELEPEAQVAAAVAAACEIRTTLPELNRSWLKLGVDQELQTRIGINTGVLSVGSFGSEGRATYTGIGLQTNIAARIQAHCEPGGILLSHTSWQLVKDRVPCEPRGSVTVKGVHFPIGVYAPTAG